MRPSGVSPLVIAVAICSEVQLPRPVALSGVRLGATNTPSEGMPKPTSEPPRYLLLSSLPRKCPGVWQSVQLMRPTRYLPRTIWSAALAWCNGNPKPAAATASASDASAMRLRAELLLWLLPDRQVPAIALPRISLSPVVD